MLLAVRIHRGSNKVVAIKVLDLDNDEDDINDIRNEIQLLSGLKDSETLNITRYQDSFLHGTKLWIIMDYAAGGSIRSLVRVIFSLTRSPCALELMGSWQPYR